MKTMRTLSLIFLILFSSVTAPAQPEELASVATLHLADGTTVAVVEWKLLYEFATWKAKDPVSSAKPQVRENAMLVLGKKTYPIKGDTLSVTHLESDDAVRVVSVSLKKTGELKIEQPARDLLAPELEKSIIYQPRSLDISGKTLSGIRRSFCVVSFSALVDCGSTKTTRVVKIDFN